MSYSIKAKDDSIENCVRRIKSLPVDEQYEHIAAYFDEFTFECHLELLALTDKDFLFLLPYRCVIEKLSDSELIARLQQLPIPLKEQALRLHNVCFNLLLDFGESSVKFRS